MSYSEPTQLRIRVSGSAVGPGRLAVRDLIDIAGRCEQVLKRIGQVLHQGASGSRGRKKSEVEQSCSLVFVSWSAGSAVAGFEPAGAPVQLPLFGDLGRQSMVALVEGLAAIEAETGEPPLPAGFDTGVLESLEALGGTLEHGIDRLEFMLPTETGVRQAGFNSSVRQRVSAMLQLPCEPGRYSVNGRLEMVSGHHGLAGQLWQPDGTRWNCTFKPDQLERLASAWMGNVTVHGKAQFNEKTRQGMIEVDRIVIHEAGPGAVAEEEWPFWTSLSLEELAEKQGVEPVSVLDDLAADWPEDDYPDEDVLEEVLRDRSARRAHLAG